METVDIKDRLDEIAEDIVEGIKDILTADILVNEQPVHIVDRTPTGHKIKAAAIRQGVHIQENFVLQQELPNGTSKMIADTDHVRIRDGMKFTAISPDDNS